MSTSLSTRVSLPRYLWQIAAQEFADHKSLLVFVAVYLIGAKLVLFAVGETYAHLPIDAEKAVTHLITNVPQYMAVFLAVASLWVVLRDRFAPSNPDDVTMCATEPTPLRPALKRTIRTLLRTAIFTALFGLTLTTFAEIKSIIPDLVPFAWDETFWQIDRSLHGGIEPWRITWTLFGGNFPTLALDRLYVLWFLVVNLAPFVVVMFDPDLRRRNRYLIAYFALWAVLGNIAAVVFSSVGPCFVGLIVALPPDIAESYAPLMTQLGNVDADTPLVALQLQHVLADSFVGIDMANLGISAMPSLHVAHAVLLCFLAWSYSRFWGAVAIVYALAVQVASVHLGWHYAIDGYAAAAGTFVIWWLAGRLMSASAASQSADLVPVRNEA